MDSLIPQLGLALAIGLLVGLERGWRERDTPDGGRTAGIRTYGISGLLGGVAAALSLSLNTPSVLIATFLVLRKRKRDLAELEELAQRYMAKIGDARTVRADVGARYFGAQLHDDTLVPGAGPRLGKISFETWFSRSGARK